MSLSFQWYEKIKEKKRNNYFYSKRCDYYPTARLSDDGSIPTTKTSSVSHIASLELIPPVSPTHSPIYNPPTHPPSHPTATLHYTLSRKSAFLFFFSPSTHTPTILLSLPDGLFIYFFYFL